MDMFKGKVTPDGIKYLAGFYWCQEAQDEHLFDDILIVANDDHPNQIKVLDDKKRLIGIAYRRIKVGCHYRLLKPAEFSPKITQIDTDKKKESLTQRRRERRENYNEH